MYIFMLLFADDTVLFSRTPGGLHIMFDQLHLYCIHSSINVNIDNTNIMVFQRGRANVPGHWFCNGHIIETVASFMYLGILLSSNGRWTSTHKRVADQASRALHGIISSFEHIELHVDQQCYLFENNC
jgi:hypothetical protein